MLSSLIRRLPLPLFLPFRYGAVALRRGSLPRSACIALLQIAARAWRHPDSPGLASKLARIAPIDGHGITFAASDSMVMDAVYWLGIQGYEGRVAEVWTALCRRAHAILEIGGNVGLFTVIGARVRPPSGRYTVVEPVPAVAALLRENLRRNGLTDVEMLQCAAIPDAAARPVRLNIPDEGRAAPVGAHLTEGSEVADRASDRVITVEGRPFLDLVEGRDLIKIDAEGIEAALLLSARSLIAAGRPTLLIEVLPEATQLATVIAELAAECGYIVSVIPEWGSSTIVTVAAADFTAALQATLNSKDVLLSVTPLSEILAP